MLIYASPAEEAGALRRAAARVGCRVSNEGVLDTSVGVRAHAHVDCRDGWQAARLVLALASEDAHTEGAKEIAAEIREDAPADADFARALHAYVKDHVHFVREKGEIFTSLAYTLETGEGDCEDHARVMYALALAGGLPARLAFLHRGAGPTHAVAQLYVDGRPVWAETTIDAEFGEHPLAAAQRLGILHTRQDLSQGVKFMSERDLPPVPSHFHDVNAPDQVQRDAVALARLGYLGGFLTDRMTDPTDPCFRRAVYAFQQAHNIAADGLIGPQTRRTIAGVLPHDDFGMGYIAASTGVAPNARVQWAWPIMLQATKDLGLSLSAESVAILLAISRLETNYGDPSTWSDSHNWGGVQFNARRGEPFVTWGFLEHGDTYEGKPVTYRFQAYPSDLEGAKDAVRVKLSGGLRGASGGAELRKALEAADVDGVAAAMKDNGYYTGIVGTREQKIAAYANGIRAHLPTVRASAPADMTFLTSSSSLVGAIVGGVLLLIGVGVAVAVNR